MKRYRVLLIEDNEQLRTLYKEIFARNNFEVFEAADGQYGIDLTLMEHPDAIILDLMMPRQGGLGALRILRSLPGCQRLPIIILTAMPNEEYQKMAEGKVQGYYLKTQIKPKELVQKVRALLDEH